MQELLVQWSRCVVGGTLAVTSPDCVDMITVIKAQKGYGVFGTALSVSDIVFDPAKSYTAVVPNDDAFSGLLGAYGIGTTEAEMKSNEYFPRLVFFLKYYILAGRYTMEDLIALSQTKTIATLFDPTTDGPQVCSDPSQDAGSQVNPSDGTLQVCLSLVQ